MFMLKLLSGSLTSEVKKQQVLFSEQCVKKLIVLLKDKRVQTLNHHRV